MDTLTQMILGASVGAVVMGKSHGRKAALVGAICGTLPDLDVFIPYDNAVEKFTYHRGFSHSILFCILMTPVLAWLFSTVKWFGIAFKNLRVHLAIFLALLTHALLDAMTIYGTQLFWPLQTPPVGLGSIFIVDPLYSIPFLLCLLWYLIFKNYKIAVAGLMISTAYLAWSATMQYHVTQIARPQIEGQLLAQPTPLNTILWRVIVVQEGQYQVGYYSLFDDDQVIEFQPYTSIPSLLDQTSWSTKRLKWFTKGFYAVRVESGDIVLSDLRMGLEPDQYVFQFVMNDEPATKFETPRDMSRLNDIWDRMVRDL